MMTSGLYVLFSSDFSVAWSSYSTPFLKPDCSKIFSKTSSPQFPCILFSDFSALVRLSASCESCSFIFCKRSSSSLSKKRSLISTSNCWRDCLEKFATCSRKGVKSNSSCSLFKAPNSFDFSSKILFESILNSNDNSSFVRLSVSIFSFE